MNMRNTSVFVLGQSLLVILPLNYLVSCPVPALAVLGELHLADYMLKYFTPRSVIGELEVHTSRVKGKSRRLSPFA